MIALFFAILLMPGILGAVLGKEAEGGNSENRTLAERPVLSWDNLEEYPSQADAGSDCHRKKEFNQ